VNNEEEDMLYLRLAINLADDCLYILA